MRKKNSCAKFLVRFVLRGFSSLHFYTNPVEIPHVKISAFRSGVVYTGLTPLLSELIDLSSDSFYFRAPLLR